MKNFKVLLLAMLVSVSAFAEVKTEEALSPQATITKKFNELQPRYFESLDLRAASGVAKFSARLNAVADEERALLLTKPVLSPSEKEQAGLIFIYDGLLTVHNNIAVENKKLTLDDLRKARHFAKHSASSKEELKARAQYAIADFEQASKLRPDDRRIDSWRLGAVANLDRIELGRLSKQTQAQILKAIALRPSFNLWTAILILHNEDASSLEKLGDAAKNFVDQMKKNDPCKAHPTDCINGTIAPFNFQAAVVELGDVFLRRAEYYLLEDDLKNAAIMTAYAEGTYAQLEKSEHAASTKEWPDNDVLTLRKSRLEGLKKRVVNTDSLVGMELYEKAYECSSCHGRASRLSSQGLTMGSFLKGHWLDLQRR